MALRSKLFAAVTAWDKRNGRNHHAGAIALQRLDEVLAEHEAGKPLADALADNFNDRLLAMLQKAAGI